MIGYHNNHNGIMRKYGVSSYIYNNITSMNGRNRRTDRKKICFNNNQFDIGILLPSFCLIMIIMARFIARNDRYAIANRLKANENYP